MNSMKIQTVRKILSVTAWIISIWVIVIVALGYPEYSEYEVMIAWMAVIVIPIMEYLFWKGIIK